MQRCLSKLQLSVIRTVTRLLCGAAEPEIMTTAVSAPVTSTMTAVRPVSSRRKTNAGHKEDYRKGLDVNNTVNLNVSGVKYEILQRTLASCPGTLLAELEKHPEYYRKDKNEFYFDRHPGAFSCIINYYRTNELHVPNDICGPVYETELEFWGIDPDEIQQCCWIRYNSDKAQRASLDNLDYLLEEEKKQNVFKGEPGRWTDVQLKLWPVLDDPTSSKIALGFGLFSLILSIISVVCLCVETVPGVREGNLTVDHFADYHGVESQQIHDSSTQSPNYHTNSEGLTAPHPTIELLDHILIVYFTLEIIARFIICPMKKRFFLDWMNVIDILSILPFYIILIVHQFHPSQKYEHNALDGLFILKILRIFRVFRIIRHSKELKVLVYTMRASWKEILIMTSFIMIGVVLFGTLIYLANHDDTFTSIPKSFWWAIVTMTTVGYGDMYPTTDWGYLVGACCTITGVLVISFTVPSIVNNFLLFYNHVQYQREPKKEMDTESKDSKENLSNGEKSQISLIEEKEVKPKVNNFINGVP